MRTILNATAKICTNSKSFHNAIVGHVNPAANFDESFVPSQWSKNEIKLRLKRNTHWKSCGVQLSLAFDSDSESLLTKVYELRTHFLFESAYLMIFHERIDHRVVTDALREFLVDCGIENDFRKAFAGEVNLLKNCISEHFKFDHCEQSEFLKSLTNII